MPSQLLVMGIDDLLRQRQDHVVADARLVFGLLDDRASVLRVPPHLGALVFGEVARLVQDVIRDADLADVVQRGQARQQVHPFGRQVAGVVGIARELFGQDAGVAFGARRVLAGLEIADARERQQRLHHQPLGGGRRLTGGVGAPPLERHARHGHGRQRSADAQRRIERRQERAEMVSQLRRRPPTAGSRRLIAPIAPHVGPTRAMNSRRQDPERDDELGFDRRGVRRAGRRSRRCSRLSATVACTSTPANSVSSGVATTSRVPSAVVPRNTSLPAMASRGDTALHDVRG